MRDFIGPDRRREFVSVAVGAGTFYEVKVHADAAFEAPGEHHAADLEAQAAACGPFVVAHEGTPVPAISDACKTDDLRAAFPKIISTEHLVSGDITVVSYDVPTQTGFLAFMDAKETTIDGATGTGLLCVAALSIATGAIVGGVVNEAWKEHQIRRTEGWKHSARKKQQRDRQQQRAENLLRRQLTPRQPVVLPAARKSFEVAGVAADAAIVVGGVAAGKLAVGSKEAAKLGKRGYHKFSILFGFADELYYNKDGSFNMERGDLPKLPKSKRAIAGDIVRTWLVGDWSKDEN